MAIVALMASVLAVEKSPAEICLGYQFSFHCLLFLCDSFDHPHPISFGIESELVVYAYIEI